MKKVIPVIATEIRSDKAIENIDSKKKNVIRKVEISEITKTIVHVINAKERYSSKVYFKPDTFNVGSISLNLSLLSLIHGLNILYENCLNPIYRHFLKGLCL